jgi:hypothetical protein
LKLLFSLPVKIFTGLFVFYCLFGYFAVNPVAKKIVPWIAENKLASRASVGKVSFDPLRLKIKIENFKLTEKNGAPLAAFDSLIVDLESSGIFAWAWKFKEISIAAPQANVAISPQGKLNWADLIAKLDEDKTPPDDTIPRIVIRHVSVKDANIAYIDATHPIPFKAALTPLAFELDGFSTLPQDRGDYLIVANFPEQGGTLRWKGNLGVNPLASKGAIAVDGVKLTKLIPLVKGVTLPLTANSGDIQTSFDYDFSLPKDIPTLKLNKIAFGLSDVACDTPAGKVSLKQANLTMPRLAFLMRQQPELTLHDIDLVLADLSLTLGKDTNTALKTNIALKSSAAKLPQLDFVMSASPQLRFQDLSLNLVDLNIKKASESLLKLPQIDVKEISLDLAKHSAKVGQVLLPNGAVNAVMDKSGAINWQRAFASPNSAKSDIAKTTSSATAIDETPFSLNISDVQLQHWKLGFLDQAFLHPLQVNVADFNLNLALDAPKGAIAITQIQSKMAGITAKSALYKQVASLDKIQLAGGEVQLKEQKVHVSSIAFVGLKTQLIKEANKPLNWQTILTPAVKYTSNKTATSQSAKKSDWAVSLKKIALENANLHVEDHSPISPIVMDVEKINVEVRDSSLNLKRALPVKAAFEIKQGGQFNTQGKLTPLPLAADFDLKLSNFSLQPFAPYINQFALLNLHEGVMDLGGKLAIKDNNDLALTFNGGFAVNKLQIVEESNNAPFLSWERVASNSLQVSLLPNRVHMAELQIIKPVGKFIIHQDKSLNVTRILRNQTASAAPEVPDKVTPVAVEQLALPTGGGMLDAAKSSIASDVKAANDQAFAPPVEVATVEEDFPINIETVRIDNAALEFADLSLTPQFGTSMHSLTGVINGVSTNAASTAQVELDGRVDDYGAVRIRGSLQPFRATNFTDLKLAFTNLEMSRLTPYSGKFAGRRIDSGKLSVDLEYKIKQRQLAGENKFVIKKLKLGEKVDSAEAANLPLDLAIAILEDSDGVIDLDLPITGSLDDPKFSYGSIVWKAIRNVLSKIITAPFRALGKLFGGGDDKLEAITFEVGSTTLSPPELEKIKMVGTALAKRQSLALGIVPGYDEVTDVIAVQEYTVRRKVAEEMGLALAEGQAAGPIDLNNPKTQKALDALHDTLTKKSLLKKLASKFEKPKEGHYQMVLETLTSSIKVTDADLQVLAKSRGEAIQKALLAAGITADRLHIEAAEKSKNAAKAKTVNVRLTLDVKATKTKL